MAVVTDMTRALAHPSMVEQWVAYADGQERRVRLPGRPDAVAGAEEVTYRTTLSDPRGPSDEIAVLKLAGLYAHAEIDVAGRFDGEGPITHNTYFAPVSVPFVPDWETELSVRCHRPKDRFGGIYETDCVASEQRVPGIWWDVDVETGGLPYLERLEVTPEYGESGVKLRVRTSILATESAERRITYSVRPEGESRGRGMMERRTVETAENDRTVVEHTVALRDPTRWFPCGVGTQNRHVLRAKLDEQERTVTFGVRDAAFDDGAIRLNGEVVPIRGVNLLDATPADVERAATLNANLVRFVGHVPPRAVYDACDRTGMLIWQDLPLTGAGSFDVDRGRALARALANQSASYPSVVVFSVHNEPVSVADGLGPGFIDRLRLRWRAWRTTYDDTDAKAVAEELPDPTFPAVCGPGQNARAVAYYPGWRYGKPSDIAQLLARYPASVVAAYGAPSNTETGFSQETVLQTVTEQLRYERTGAIACGLRDGVPESVGVYDQQGNPKPTRAVLARAFEPVQAVLTNPSGKKSTVAVVNDTTHKHELTVSVTADEQLATFELEVGADDVWESDPVRIPQNQEITLALTGGTVDIENSY